MDVNGMVNRPLAAVQNGTAPKEGWKRYDTRNSPFLELQTPFTAWEATKMVLLLPTVPIRMAIALASLVVLAAMSFTAALNWPLEEPMPPWRRRIVTASANFAGVVVAMLGFRTRVRGYENYAKGNQLGAIGLFNHTSWVDAVVIMWLFAPCGVSKASNADIPLIGTCIKAYQNVYVSRESIENQKRAGAESISQKIAKRARDRRFPMLFMAPEGTCGSGRCVLRFRTGAFVPGVPVLPVCVAYNKAHHNPAWTIMHLGWHFLRMACQFGNTLDVTVLPPYVPSEAERADPKLYAKNVQGLYARTLGVPVVDQSQEEFTALFKRGITVSLDGRKVLAPPGLVDSQGIVDLTAEAPSKKSKRR